jgi:hypothetical protein
LIAPAICLFTDPHQTTVASNCNPT